MSSCYWNCEGRITLVSFNCCLLHEGTSLYSLLLLDLLFDLLLPFKLFVLLFLFLQEFALDDMFRTVLDFLPEMARERLLICHLAVLFTSNGRWKVIGIIYAMSAATLRLSIVLRNRFDSVHHQLTCKLVPLTREIAVRLCLLFNRYSFDVRCLSACGFLWGKVQLVLLLPLGSLGLEFVKINEGWRHFGAILLFLSHEDLCEDIFRLLLVGAHIEVERRSLPFVWDADIWCRHGRLTRTVLPLHLSSRIFFDNLEVLKLHTLAFFRWSRWQCPTFMTVLRLERLRLIAESIS